ncbi:MAG: class I SAM-dependent methyltransferase [Faecalimonas sp.]|nr:class I SAM-dependent methyltransferase [Faecalimonas sp.]
MELSKRLQAVADLLCSSGLELQSIADVGTDHGYLPIYLVSTDRCKKAFAMDINKGPLGRAEAHIAAYGLGGQIETRLSDGVQALEVGEADSVICAGIGGALAVRILMQGEAVFRSLKCFLLQPQSELWKVREFLFENGYRIVAEDMVFEDGKFYPMMRVETGTDTAYDETELRYGRCLLAESHPVLKTFLEKELQTKEQILKQLSEKSGEDILRRKEELYNDILLVRQALGVYF